MLVKIYNATKIKIEKTLVLDWDKTAKRQHTARIMNFCNLPMLFFGAIVTEKKSAHNTPNIFG